MLYRDVVRLMNKILCQGIVKFKVREAANKKNNFLEARPLRGGGGKGMANKKKEPFLKLFEKNPQKNVATKLEGGGGAPITK